MYLLHMVLYYRKTFSCMHVLYIHIDHNPSSNTQHLTMAEVHNMTVKSLATEVAIIH